MGNQNSEALKTVLLADDHLIVRRGIADILTTIRNTKIIAEAENGLDAIALLKLHKPDMAVLDAAMPHAKGIEVLADCRRWSPATRVVLLTGFTSAGILREWLDAGVEGMLLKSSPEEDMITAFETVLMGGKYIAPDVQEILTDTPHIDQLTHREREVLSLIASGHQNKSIADRLSISKRTVEKHRSSLMLKLDATSVAELMVYALKEGLLDGHKQL